MRAATPKKDLEILMRLGKNSKTIDIMPDCHKSDWSFFIFIELDYSTINIHAKFFQATNNKLLDV